MHFDGTTLRALIFTVLGTFGIALEILSLHTIVWVKHWLEIRTQVDAMRMYSDVVQAAVNYAEEWAHQESLTHHKVFGEDKLKQALYYITRTRGPDFHAPNLKLDIHVELGRKRSLRLTSGTKLPPPPLPTPAPTSASIKRA